MSSVFGEPMTSLDVDICLRMTEVEARRLSGLLPARFYRDEESLVDIARRGGMANLIDTRTHLKIDLSVLDRTPYYDSVLARRTRIDYGDSGLAFWTVSPEDIVLMKLIWRSDTFSAKQWDNALSVVRAQGNKLEWSYLRDWADQLGLRADLNRLAVEGGI